MSASLLKEPVDQVIARYVRLSATDTNIESHSTWEESAEIRESQTWESLPVLTEQPVSPRRSLPLPDQIWQVLTNRRFRNGSRALVERYRTEIMQPVQVAIESNEPIEIVLPTIPFKDQNPTTTGQPTEAIDLGEHALVAQLRDMCLSVEHVYEPGLKIQLISDGLVYAFLARNETDRICRYRQNIVDLINTYGMAARILVTDFASLAADDNFQTQLGIWKDVLTNAWDESTARQRLRSLQIGMLVNTALDDFSISEIEDLRVRPIEQWPEGVQQTTRDATSSYAAFLIAAGESRVLYRTFPGALRATVHHKDAAQLPLHTTNDRSCIAPYNGVPVIQEGDESLRRSLRIERLSKILASKALFTRYSNGEGLLQYFERQSE